MQKILLATIVVVSFATEISAEENKSAPPGNHARVPGLLATFRDDARSVSEVVMLPELGLAAEESPHPAIKPAFSFRFEGFLEVAQAGTYQFDTKGTLTIAGEAVAGGRRLEAGQHPIVLSGERAPGDLRFGISWQSEHFAKEPLPPSVLRHAPVPPFPENADGIHPAPSHRIRQLLAAMNCVSCHDATFLATMHHKFAPDALLPLMRHARQPRWYGAMTGPLLEESEALVFLAADLRKLPGGAGRTGGDARHDPAKGMAMVGTKTGLACIACHDIKQHRTAAESKGTNLALVAQNVSYDWFVRWMSDPQRMKPGVPMPAFFAGQAPGERQRQIDTLWDYLSQGNAMELPEELRTAPRQFVLEPGSAPMVHRVYFRLPDGRELLRAICVGLPNGMSYCFDADTCRLAYVWSGGYLDMEPHWKSQSLRPVPAVGEAWYLPSAEEGLRVGDQVPVFRGYEIVEGIPRFEFAYGQILFRLRIDAPSPREVRQTFQIPSQADAAGFVGPAGGPVRAKASTGEWTGNRLSIPGNGDVNLILKLERSAP
jgi:hypothetical protein